MNLTPLANVQAYQKARNSLAPSGAAGHGHEVEALNANKTQGRGLRYLQNTSRKRKNLFEALMEAVKTLRWGQISQALYDVGGEYRRNM